MERSILFFDIDGTILTEDGTRRIPDSTRQAISRAKERGHLTFINTGRVFLNIEPMIRALDFDGYVCGCGTNIYYQEKELFRNRISKELCRQTVLAARASKVEVLYEAAELNAVDVWNRDASAGEKENRKFRELIDYFSRDGRAIGRTEDADFHFDKFTFWYPLEQNIQSFLDFLQKYYDIIDRGQEEEYGMYEVVPKGFSKGTGVQYLLDHFQISRTNSYAFGDSTNDLAMLTDVAHGIAMGGSPAVVQEKVEFVTRSIDEDGLFYAMEHFHLI